MVPARLLTDNGDVDRDRAKLTSGRIDVLAQAWAVISGAVRRERAALAMQAVERELVLDPPGMVRLLAPPFKIAARSSPATATCQAFARTAGVRAHGALWAVRAWPTVATTPWRCLKRSA